MIDSGGRHLSASDILPLARKEMPAIALGTIYRNLDLMTAEGELSRISLPGRPDVYDTKTEKHDHMVCVSCGAIRDMLIPGLSDAIDYQTGEKTLGYSLVISYQCPACQAKGRM